jgi:hypothetical protein
MSVERRGDPGYAPPAFSGLAAKSEPWQGRHDEIERVARVPAMGSRVAQWAEDLQELVDRARPAVHQHQRQRVGA